VYPVSKSILSSRICGIFSVEDIGFKIVSLTSTYGYEVGFSSSLQVKSRQRYVKAQIDVCLLHNFDEKEFIRNETKANFSPVFFTFVYFLGVLILDK
jgi:hypothetical protein